jgi:hypothetical protein
VVQVAPCTSTDLQHVPLEPEVHASKHWKGGYEKLGLLCLHVLGGEHLHSTYVTTMPACAAGCVSRTLTLRRSHERIRPYPMTLSSDPMAVS